MRNDEGRARPVWLLDVDGVVNALARGPVRDSFPADDWRQVVVRADMPGHGVMVLPIYVAQPVLDFVTAVHESGRVEVRWHSTWRSAAVTELAPALGLPAIPISVAPEWTQRPPARWWKQPAAERVLAAGRRLVWTDDDIEVFRPELGHLLDRDDALLIAVQRESGLTQADLDRIADFLQL